MILLDGQRTIGPYVRTHAGKWRRRTEQENWRLFSMVLAEKYSDALLGRLSWSKSPLAKLAA